MNENLDQERARFAWDKVNSVVEKRGEYAKLAKGAPALIMQAGLMPILAFLNQKAEPHHRSLLDHVCKWLHSNEQFRDRIASAQFKDVMEALLGKADGNAADHARFYQQATEEVLALLRWIRQFASAVAGGKESGND